MNTQLAKIGMINCIKGILDEIKEIVTSVEEVNQSIKEVEELTKGLNIADMLGNIETIAKMAALQTKVEHNSKEMQAATKIMAVHGELTRIYITEEIPTVREMSRILAMLHLALEEFEKVFKDKKDVKMPSNELYKVMFSLINIRIMAQK